jgi:hypothetical protein
LSQTHVDRFRGKRCGLSRGIAKHDSAAATILQEEKSHPWSQWMPLNGQVRWP